jgi:ABC-type multidrug transport system fused ATPase/permease subunit
MTWIGTILPWLVALIAVLFAAIAASAARSAARLTREVSASVARLSGELSERATTKDLTASSLAELAELRDAIDKGNELLKRVNQREVMRARRETPINPHASKDELRRAAGLVAGKPAPHKQ